MFLVRGVLLITSAALALAACNKSSPAGTQCSKNADCGSGEVCRNGACAVVCDSGDHCPAGLGCVEGVCAACTGDDHCGSHFKCDVVLGQCLTRCSSDADCAADGWCNDTRCAGKAPTGAACDRARACETNHCASLGVCCPPECASSCTPEGVCLADLGEGCSSSAACASGYCADGVCCDAACDAACQVCNAAVARGTCSPIVLREDALCTTDASGARACDAAGACQMPHDVFNIDKGGGPAELVELASGVVVFSANHRDTGRELWVLDAAGPRLLFDIYPGPASSWPRRLTLSTDKTKVFFVAHEPDFGAEVWVTDGTAAGTRRLSDTQLDSNTYQPTSVTAALGGVFFVASSADEGTELWYSDGTPAGTKSLDVFVGPDSSVGAGQPLAVLDDMLVFAARNGASSSSLYRAYKSGSDVTTAALSGGAGITSASQFARLGDKLYFRGTTSTAGTELFYVEGTTVYVYDLVATDTSSYPSQLTALGSKLFFTANVGGGEELYVTSGSTPTKIDINPSDSSWPYGLTATSAWLYFFANDGTSWELWRTDSLTHQKVSNIAGAGFVLAYDISAGESWVAARIWTDLHGIELWRSSQVVDLAAAQASTAVIDLWPGVGSSNPSVLTVQGDTAYVAATLPGYGRELVAVDLASGDYTVIELVPGSGSSLPEEMLASSSGLLFGGVAADGQYHLYSIAGGGTSPADLGAVGEGSAPDYLGGTNGAIRHPTLMPNGKLVFVGSDGAYGWELWVADADLASARRISDIYPGAASGVNTTRPVLLGDVLVFAGSDPTYGSELWISDGTPEGTRRVSDIARDKRHASPTSLTRVGSEIVFTAADDSGQRELYRFNGVKVERIIDLNGSASGGPSILTVADGKLYFRAETAAEGREPWVYDPNGGGSTPSDNVTFIADIYSGVDSNGRPNSSNPLGFVSFKGKVYFIACAPACSLYSTSGASATLVPGTSGLQPNSLTVAGDHLYFLSGSEDEPYSYDGSMLTQHDIVPGTEASHPAALTAINDRVYFYAELPTDDPDDLNDGPGIYEGANGAVRRLFTLPERGLYGPFGWGASFIGNVAGQLLVVIPYVIDAAWGFDVGRLFVWNPSLPQAVRACGPGLCMHVSWPLDVGGRLFFTGSSGAGTEPAVFP